jgi:L-phenylalanine/L-methionine N-acetyltransferase
MSTNPPKPPIHEDVYVRKASREDSTPVAELCSSPEIYENFLTMPYPSPDVWADACGSAWDLPLLLCAFEKNSNRLVAMGSLFANGKNRRSLHIGLLGIAVAPAFQRKGIARSIVTQLIGVGQSFHQLNRLEALISTRNLASLALFKSLGFEIEGTMRAWATGAHGYHDVHFCARLSPSLKQMRSAENTLER